jgi:hypothetical protein
MASASSSSGVREGEPSSIVSVDNNTPVPFARFALSRSLNVDSATELISMCSLRPGSCSSDVSLRVQSNRTGYPVGLVSNFTSCPLVFNR